MTGVDRGWAPPTPTAGPPPPGPGPTGFGGPPVKLVLPTPNPAGVASRLAVFVAIGVATAAYLAAGAAPAPIVVCYASLAIGAVLAGITEVARVLFRSVTAWLGALVVFVALLILITMIGMTTEVVVLGVLAATFVTAGLDLCWVPRLRLTVFLSGFLFVPTLNAMPGAAVLWAVGWLVALVVALWLLSLDDARALARPEGNAARPLQGQPADPLRILGLALCGAVVLGLLLSAPSCNIRPLADLAKHLPFRPNIGSPKAVDGVPIQDYEIDAKGHEVQFDLDLRGRRFVSADGRSLAVVRTGDGVDEFLDSRSKVWGRMTEGASKLVALDAAGASTTYQRDDRGWFLTAGGKKFWVAPVGYGPSLVDETARFAEVDPDGHVVTGGPGFEALDDVAGPIVFPAEPILAGTIGSSGEAQRDGGKITIETGTGSWRTYESVDGRLLVSVHRYGEEFRYRWDEDRSAVEVSSATASARITIDRRGNAFDGLRNETTGGREPDPSSDRPDDGKSAFGSGAKQVAIVVVVAALVALGVYLFLWWRRRQEDEDRSDRSWAEIELRRLEQVGRDHGVRRRSGTSVVRYLDELATEVDEDDPRIRDVAEVIDDGLYGHRPLRADERLRVSSIIDRVVEERPQLSRAERKEKLRAEALADSST